MTRRIAYWLTTGLTAFVFLSGGAADIARPGFVMEGMTHLGYPAYFVLILGVWKVLGGGPGGQDRGPAHHHVHRHGFVGPSPRESQAHLRQTCRDLPADAIAIADDGISHR